MMSDPIVIEHDEVSLSEIELLEYIVPGDYVSDSQRKQQIAERFAILQEMAAAACAGYIRGMIVSGPPGVGKSHGIQQELEKMTLLDRIADRDPRWQVVKGAMTAVGLYCKLYEFSDEGNVLVFDDCDSILQDELSLNLLKAALDSGKKRRIFWNSDSRLLNQENIPNDFEFKGTVIFVTNVKFENIRSKKLRDHLEALESRCHYLDLTLDTDRDKFLRIEQIAETGELFLSQKLTDEQADEVLTFMQTNKAHLREISLRMAVKIADLYKTSKRWKEIASITCMKRMP
jgi:hypothetical protein